MIRSPHQTPGYQTITIEEFDALARDQRLWESGPEIERPDPQGPYQPQREVRGTLKTGEKLRAVRG
jgi:hypothetical protein